MVEVRSLDYIVKLFLSFPVNSKDIIHPEMSTQNDKEILNAIFNPLLPSGSLQFDENIPFETPDDEDGESQDIEQVKALEVEGIKYSENKEYEKAYDIFCQAIKICPLRASGFNNRAQVLRLQGKIEEAKSDLNNAINLSHRKGKAACQAFCQRGLIYLKENNSEAAKVDFEAAAQLGSQFAKAQLVQMNPYAALCNKMLRGVFERLQRGTPTNLDQDDNDNSKSKV